MSKPGRAGIVVPAVVRNKALAAGAEHWLDDLPGLIAELERDWSITVGRQYDGGTEAFVAEATLADGTAAVLKLHIARPGGQARNEILCAAAEKVWRPATGCGLPTGAEKGRWLADFITTTWQQLEHPCPERAIGHALGCLADRIRAHDDERAVRGHGDVHQWNALQAGPGRFKLVDPDGLLAEAEYDLGVLMREDPVELMHGDPRQRARWLAARCGLDADAIWQWGVAERVSTGLLCTQVGLQPAGRQMLAAADYAAGY